MTLNVYTFTRRIFNFLKSIKNHFSNTTKGTFNISGITNFLKTQVKLIEGVEMFFAAKQKYLSWIYVSHAVKQLKSN